MRKYVLLTLALLFSTMLVGRNLLKEARAAIKSGSDLDAMETKLMEAVGQEEKLKKKADYYYYAALLNRKRNDIENEKLYLKEAYDTVRFFGSIYNLFRRVQQCDSIVAQFPPSRKSRRYWDRMRRLLLPYRSNLLNGGKYYLMKHQYKEAYDYFDCYIDMSCNKLFSKENFLEQDTMMPRAARWATVSAYRLNDPYKVLKHESLALVKEDGRCYVQEFLAKAYWALGDTANWTRTLTEGLMQNPDFPYFFASLMDHLNVSKRYDEALHLADTMIYVRPHNAFFWYAKSLILLNQHQYESCVAAADSAIVYDSLYVNAYYNKGLAFCNMAQMMKDSAASHLTEDDYQILHQKSIAYYAQALRPMEIVRALAPHDTRRWAPPLYRIYLNLNMGEQFAEMEAILKKLTHDKS